MTMTRLLVVFAMLGCATHAPAVSPSPTGARESALPPITAEPAPGDYGYGWRKPPGPIAGRWQTRCDQMVVEVRLLEPTRAAGFVHELVDSSGRGYVQGEQILRLSADEYGGDWVGELKWRGGNGVERWDPIRFVSTKETLDAVMTTDDCYRAMPRVH